jgi:hypothetical protein
MVCFSWCDGIVYFEVRDKDTVSSFVVPLYRNMTTLLLYVLLFLASGEDRFSEDAWLGQNTGWKPVLQWGGSKVAQASSLCRS